jgi:hypothetical protein
MSNSDDRRLFTQGPRVVRDRLNRLREDANSLLNYNLRGSEFIKVQHVSGRAQTISLNLKALLRRLGKRGGGGNGIRRAYVKTVPSSGNTLAAYLDTDETGKEITVQCDIYSYSGTGTFASDVRPTMIDGRMLKVYKKDGAWRNATDIHVVEAC